MQTIMLMQPLRRLLRRADIDLAIGYTLINRIWMLGSNAVTMLFIVHFLDGTQQGLYFTFLTLLGLHIVFDFGFSYTITQWVAREGAQLSRLPDGAETLSADTAVRARVGALLGQAAPRVLALAMAFLVFALVTGYWLFGSDGRIARGDWLLPWLLVCLLTTLRILLLSVEGTLEGLGRVELVARARLAGLVSGTVAMWIIMLAGGALYGMVASAGLLFAVPLAIYLRRFHKLFHHLAAAARANRGAWDWKAQVWPFQWKYAISTLSTLLVLNLFNPAVFHFQGAEAAGRFGLGLSIANSVAGFMSVWLNCKVPLISSLTAGQRHDELRALFRSTKRNALAVAILAGSAALLLVTLLKEVDPALGARIPAMTTLAVLLLAAVLQQYILTVAVFARAQKREPLLVSSLIIALITPCILPFLVGAWGALGAGVSYLLPVLFISAPCSYRINCRVQAAMRGQRRAMCDHGGAP
ncbi:hypothetical protein [Noviherbaspirillum pedocola]|uniref:Polysaccharide biosynthesis protein n=1 Tax=Noviherbaspirillum pedocola TaxID=2801341 RepID=A0A934SUA7_9BURK|nr:hypothetical protein [Noviherbaspirillum pedocola]MBK4736710.1 hypothetical protein [Noviherbaspirillum pedocola]